MKLCVLVCVMSVVTSGGPPGRPSLLSYQALSRVVLSTQAVSFLSLHPSIYLLGVLSPQGFMQDENVTCRDLGKVSLERRFGMSQPERATRFPMPQLKGATHF